MMQQRIIIRSVMMILQKMIVIGIVLFVKHVAIGVNGIVTVVINVCIKIIV
jgi:hypothetical protein